jgi:hypothetical protein
MSEGQLESYKRYTGRATAVAPCAAPGKITAIDTHRVTLAEVRILRFAICHDLQIDAWQGLLAGPARLRRAPGAADYRSLEADAVEIMMRATRKLDELRRLK